MKRSIEKLRYEYGNTPLLEEALALDPIIQFEAWLGEALHSNVLEPNGMTLSTVTPLGHPTSRIVLLKKVDRKGGFTFYTHYSSRKGEHLVDHPFGSLTFWWKEIFRQVTIEGKIAKTSRKDALAYFRKRPRGAQLAAVASQQSEPLATRAEIEETFEVLKKKYRGKEVPCPKEWGGYRLEADRIEFWQGRQNRLHDRFLYVKANDDWLITRLSP